MANVEEPATEKPTKVFNDSVHGHIEMHPLLVKIIDTPEFQRLRNIKQLGGGYYVYPGASHNRFEHSIGVAHLAGQLVKSLRDRQGLGITEEDVLCVQIAGLCHDLGHGPFSHAFEDFMEKRKWKKHCEGLGITDENDICKRIAGLCDDQVYMEKLKWKHENQSVKMMKHLGIENIPFIAERINCPFHEENPLANMIKYLDEQDIKFIEELINPPSDENFTGRPDKPFLYEIVSNKKTEIDVDKMDYFSRDSLHLGMKSNFSHERYIMFARVCAEEDGQQQIAKKKAHKRICVRDKEARNMYELFHIRNTIHHTACHHRVTKAVEMMIVDALLAADGKIFQIEMNENENTIDLSDFMKLTDDILQQIVLSPNPELQTAKDLIGRIKERNLYRFIGAKLFTPNDLMPWDSDEKQKSHFQKKLNSWISGEPDFNATDFEITTAKFDYGMGEKDPIEELRFYRKTDKDTAIKLTREEVSYMLPVIFKEVKVMLFYKGEKGEVENRARDNIDSLWAELLTVDQ